MSDFERYVKLNMHPLYAAHYALWVYWWPWWRRLSSGGILRKWERSNLVREGQAVLDYGCGAGSFTIPAARIVGKAGKVYALDCFSRQLEIVQGNARKAGLDNVKTILSDNGIRLSDKSIDVIWMCDVLHELEDRRLALEELHRVLKEDGTLAIYDSMKDGILNYTDGLFSPTDKDGKFYRFSKLS